MATQNISSRIIPEGTILQTTNSRPVKGAPTGILRLEVGKPGRLSAEFKFDQKEVLSPQPSVDRLSVKFAEDSIKSVSSKSNLDLAIDRMQQLQQQQTQQYQQDRVQFPEKSIDDNESDEEDYSASVNAIFQRRVSTRRSKKQSRRASSPFLPETPGTERRRSSVFTTSSGDTAITVDENAANEVTQDEIFENIKLHKEVLSNVKMQPWTMRKKLKLVLQAKSYIKKHEGQLQERLAQSHSTKDMLARWNIVLIKKWQKWKRELTNISMWFIPWELKIKEIESHFGSVVASYFIFLRWLFWVNIVIAVVIISFVTIPEIITADTESVKERKFVLPEEKYNSTNFLTLWDFEGVFKYSPLFYGWYTNRDYNDSTVLSSYDGKHLPGHGYRLPFAYFVTGLVVYAYSFFATLRKMAENSRMSKLSEKDDECIFSWKLFTAWDYMIGNAETAHNRVASIVMGFKEALLEEAEKKRESRNWKVICFRVLVNTLVVGLLTCSAFAVVIVVKRSTDAETNSTVWRRNEITVVMSLITLFFPMLFEVLGFVEQYHPRKQLRLQLARIMVLNLLNLYSLIFALFDKITGMTNDLQTIKTNLSRPQTTDIAFYTTPMTFEASEPYYDESTSLVQCLCNDSPYASVISLGMVSSVAQNLSTVLTPTLNNLVKSITKTVIASTENVFLNTTESVFNSSSFSFDTESTTYSVGNFTSYNENASLHLYENLTDSIDPFTNTSFSDTEFADFNVSIEDIKGFFVDYLTFVLSPFIGLEASDVGSSDHANFSSNNSLFIENSTISTLNFTTDYEYFKSSLSPLFNNTFPQEEQRFDVELSSIFQEVSTTISSLPDIFTTVYTTEFADTTTEKTDYIYCQRYCKSIRDAKVRIPWPSTSTVASTAVTMVSYGDVEYRKTLNYSMKAKLRSLCWETMFGQELIKLTVMDLIVTGLSILMMDFFRGIFVRVMNRCWCWDLEKKFPQYGDFKVAENILHLVNNQGMVWMGMFFSPGIVVLNVVKLYILMYLRAWAVLTCNVPHEIIFRASRSNNFYYALLLMMLFLCVLPVGYAIVWIEPSWHCGPFSGHQKIFHIFTKTIRANVPGSMHRALDYIASPGIVIPLLLLLVLIIYYLVSLTGALREANNDLKIQLRRERTEERRKMFQLADRRIRGGSGESNDQTPFSKWKKLLGNLPNTRSCEDARQESDDIVPSQRDEEEEEEEKVENKGKVFFTRLIKKALRKSSTSEDEQDGTDTDQHDSLPYDNSHQYKEHKVLTTTASGELQTLQGIVSKWYQRRNSQKDEKAKEIEVKRIRSESKTEKDLINIDKAKTTDLNLDPETFSKEKKSAILLDQRKSSEHYQGNIPSERSSRDSKSALRVAIHKTPSANLKDDKHTNVKNNESKVLGSHKMSDNSKHLPRNVRQQTHSGDRKRIQKSEMQEDTFLKRVIEAKKLGLFDTGAEKVILEQPRTSRDLREQRSKAEIRMKGKSKKSIIELDEGNIEQDQLITQIPSYSSQIAGDGNQQSKARMAIAERQDSSSSIWSDNIPVITISKTYSDENILDKEDYTYESAFIDKRIKSKGKTRSTGGVAIEEETNKGSTGVDVRRRFLPEENPSVLLEDRDEETGSTEERSETTQALATYFDKINKTTGFRPRVKCILKKQATAFDEDTIIHFGEDLERIEADKQMILKLINTKTAEARGFVDEECLPSTSYQDEILETETRLDSIPEAIPLKIEGGSASDRSTSDDTEIKDVSIDTILNSPYYTTDDNEKVSPSSDTHEEKDENCSQDSSVALEMDESSIDDDTDRRDSNRDLELDVEDYSRPEYKEVLELQRPSMKSRDRSQTESSSYYTE